MHRMFVSSSFVKTRVYTGMHLFCCKTHNLCFETLLFSQKILVGARYMRRFKRIFYFFETLLVGSR